MLTSESALAKRARQETSDRLVMINAERHRSVLTRVPVYVDLQLYFSYVCINDMSFTATQTLLNTQAIELQILT